MGKPKGIALLSGGLDSCTAIAVAEHEHGIETTHTLTVTYGQRHIREIRSAEAVASFYQVLPHSVNIPLGEHIPQGSALLNTDEPLPKDLHPAAIAQRIPRSYVPGRNTILLALAQSLAEAWDLDYIIAGFNAVDYSGYPDCRPIYVNNWNAMAHYATKRGYEGRPITVLAPLIEWGKAHVVRAALDYNAPLHLTWSCYEGRDKACGRCDSCRIRLAAFAQLGEKDPCEYEQQAEGLTV